jgi:hypothetical protein
MGSTIWPIRPIGACCCMAFALLARAAAPIGH